MTNSTVEGWRALVVPTDGAVRQVVIEDRGDHGLADLRAHTGSEYLEHVRGPGCSLWVDEEGAVVTPARDPNPRIDQLLARPDGWSIRGDVVVTGSVRTDGNMSSLAADDVVRLMKTMQVEQDEPSAVEKLAREWEGRAALLAQSVAITSEKHDLSGTCRVNAELCKFLRKCAREMRQRCAVEEVGG